MIEKLRNEDPPYTPDVMSWLSAKLDKRASRIDEKDVKQLLE
jgi:hypothetical protein